jgi:hypothetical protein
VIGRVISTSVRQGLGAGPGFQQVLRTKALPPVVFERAAELSGYQHPFPAGDSRNPISYFHRIEILLNRRWHFLGRVSDAVSDYSGRTNRLSQILVLDDDSARDQKVTPGDILRSFAWEQSWADDRKPILEAADTVLPAPQLVKPPCLAWRSTCGDSGWAGELARSANDDEPATVIVGPNDDTLLLFTEAMSLLPMEKTWQVEFATWGQENTQILWRGIRSDIDTLVQKNNKNVHVFDLAAMKKQQQRPSNEDSVFVQKARGLSVPATSTPAARVPSKPVPSKGTKEQAVLRGQTVRRVKPKQVGIKKPRDFSRGSNTEKSSPPGKFNWWVGGAVALVLLIFAVFSVYLLTQTSELRGREQRAERLAGLDGPVGPSSREHEKSRETESRVSDVVTSNDAGKEANETSENKPQESKTEASPDPHELSGMNEGTPISVTPAVDPAAKKNRQKENRKHARDVLKSADKLLSLPRWNNYDPHPLGLPWEKAFTKVPLKVELIPRLQLGNSPSFKFEPGEEDLLWKVVQESRPVFAPGVVRSPVANIDFYQDQLCWKWNPGTQEPTAIAVLFSSMKIGGEEFYFLEKPEPFTHEISIEELIDFGDKDTEIIFSDEQLAQCTAPNNEHDSLESQQLNWKDLKAAGLTPMFFIECSATGFDKKLELLYDLKNLKTNQDIPVLQFVKDIDWTKEPNVKIRIEIRLQKIESDKGMSLNVSLTPKWFVGGNWIPSFQGFSAKEFVKNSRKDIDLRLEDIFQWRGQDVEELAVDLDNLKNKDAKGIVEASLELQEKTGVVWLNNFVRDQVPLKKAKLQQLQKAMESYKEVHSWENDNKTAGKIKRSKFYEVYAGRTDELFEAFERVFNAFNNHTVKLRDKSRDSNNQELEKWKNLKEKIERLKDEQLEVRVFCKVIGTMGKEVKLFWDD